MVIKLDCQSHSHMWPKTNPIKKSDLKIPRSLVGKDLSEKLAMIGLKEKEIWSVLSSFPSHALTEIWTDYDNYFLDH